MRYYQSTLPRSIKIYIKIFDCNYIISKITVRLFDDDIRQYPCTF